MRIALYQGPPIEGDIEAGFARLETWARAAASAGARMAVFPELFLPGYNRPDLHDQLSQSLGGAWTKRLATLARASGCGLCLGWAEREGDAVYNAATAFSASGEILDHYRKIQLYGPMEKASFAPGHAYRIFEFEGVTAAMLICYDVEFSHHVGALARMGARLILVPTANPAGFEHVSRLLVPARASEYALTIAYANYCGSEKGLAFGGHSLIVGPDGRPLASAGTSETLLVTEIGQKPDPALLSTQMADFRKLPE